MARPDKGRRRRRAWRFKLDDSTILEVSAPRGATEKQLRRRGRVSFFIGTLLAALVASAVSGAAVWTDQPDYSPGSVVTISGDNSDSPTGGGYTPGETVEVTIWGPNEWTGSCTAVVQADGAWSCQAVLDPNPDVAVGNYTYTATGRDSSTTESGSFTDQASVVISGSDPNANTRPWFNGNPASVAIAGTYTCTTGGTSCTTPNSVTVVVKTRDPASNGFSGTTVASANASTFGGGSWSHTFSLASGGPALGQAPDGLYDVRATFNFNGGSSVNSGVSDDHFGIDRAPPSSAITLVTPGNPLTANGTASDATSGFNAGNPKPLHVEIRVGNPGGSTVAGTGQDLNVSGTGTWSYSTSTFPTSPGTYCVVSQATDLAGNVQSVVGSSCYSIVAPNSDPVIGSNDGSVTVDEGQQATNTGTWSDSNVGDSVSMSASVGSVVKTGTNAAGTWSWSFNTTDGPDESQTVTITADDGNGGTSSTTFELDVDNVAPVVTLKATNDVSVDESSTAEVTYSYSIADPGADTVDSVTTDCGDDGDKVSETFDDTSGSFKCIFPDGGTTPPGTDTIVSASATDSDNETGAADTQTVNVKNVAPTIANFVITVPTGAACQGAANNVGVSFTVSDPADEAHDAITGTITWGDGHTESTSGRTISKNHDYGAGVWSLTVSVNDNDGGSDSAGTVNNVSLLYNTSGILQPINMTGPRSSFKIGSTVPVKIRVTDCAGASVPGLTLKVKLQKLDGSANPVNETVEVSVPDIGDLMRYDATGLQYIYNLSTKRSQLCSSMAPCTSGGDLTPGTYRVTVYDSVIAPVWSEIDTR